MRPGARPGGSTAPPRPPLRLRVDTRYADGGGPPPMDYRDDRLRQHPNQTALECPYNQHEDALGVVAQRPVAKIRRDRFGLVEPTVQRQIVFRSAAPLLHRGEGVMITVSHRRLLRIRVANIQTRCSARCS